MMTPTTPSNPPSRRPSVQLRFFECAIAAPIAAQNSQTRTQVATTAGPQNDGQSGEFFDAYGFRWW